MVAAVLALGIALLMLSCARGAMAWKAYSDRQAELRAGGWL